MGATTSGASPGMATAALVLGIVGLPLFFLLAPSVVALVLGLVAADRARQRPGPGDGRGRAVAGWIMGLIGVLGFIALIIGAAVAGDDEEFAPLEPPPALLAFDRPGV